ncbi:MAG: hypothetical protein AAF720_01070 [Pseudomonadota bacterium]
MGSTVDRFNGVGSRRFPKCDASNGSSLTSRVVEDEGEQFAEGYGCRESIQNRNGSYRRRKPPLEVYHGCVAKATHMLWAISSRNGRRSDTNLPTGSLSLSSI